VQACWRGDIAVQNFLSAPMLSELAAVEVKPPFPPPLPSPAQWEDLFADVGT